MKTIHIQDISIGKDSPFTLISGPCVIESENHALETAHFLKELANECGIQLIYKSSYDKANRTSIHSYRGPGIKDGLAILSRVKEAYGLPVLSDIHLPSEAQPAAEVLDVLQIPAFLARQTDLLVACAKTQKVINVKKGQFMAPWDMQHVVDKLQEAGNTTLLLCDRGTTFGYNNLVTDVRAIPIMQNMGYPVVFDASHSVQLPGGLGSSSGGQREYIPTLAKAALAAGANCIFMESHPDPHAAKSDATSVFPFDELKNLLMQLKKVYETVQSF